MDRFNEKVPFPLRLIGCWGIERSAYRFNWGEFSTGLRLALEYCPGAHVSIAPLIGSLWIYTSRNRERDWDAPRYGLSIGWGDWRTLHLHWGKWSKVLWLPWDWKHVRWTVLRPDGTPWTDSDNPWHDVPEVLIERHKFRYLRFNGETQECAVTCHGVEGEWRWRALTWCPWPRKISRTVHLEFDKEMGEGVDTWKGGVIGAGCDWREGERIIDAVRRYEREAKFGR